MSLTTRIKQNKRKIKVEPLQPYPYQQKIINKAGQTLIHSDRKSAFVVSPPGSGKTLMMAAIAKMFTDKKVRVLVMVHLTEIVEQIKKTFIKQGVDMNYIQVDMVQTLTRHPESIKEPYLIITDEAHHAAANTYLKIYNYLGNKYKLFFTATPWRADGKGFEELANNNDMVEGPTVKWLIEHKKLAPFKYYSNVLVDKSKLKVSKKTGDYTQASINQQTKKINVNEMIRMYQDLGDNQQGIIYCSSIEQSKKVTDAFNNAGIKTVHLDGASNDNQRAQWLQDYRDGKIQMLSNVQIFTEGVDLPNARIALIARPTKSLALYFQFSMRVLRYQPNKIAKIIDFSGVANELGLPDQDFEWTLLSRNTQKDKLKKPPIKICPNCDFTFSTTSGIIKRGINPEPAKGHSSDEEGTLILCPQCKSFVDFFYDQSDWATDEENDLGYLDDEQRRLNHLKWLDNASLSRSQGLQTNAEILHHQQPKISANMIIMRLLKLYIPRWNKNDKPELVLGSTRSSQDFSDKAINRMYETIEAEPNIEKFKTLYADRISITKSDYIRNIDITHLDASKSAFKEIIEEKLRLLISESSQFGDAPSHNSIMTMLGENILTNMSKQNRTDNKFKKLFLNNIFEQNIFHDNEFQILSKTII